MVVAIIIRTTRVSLATTVVSVASSMTHPVPQAFLACSTTIINRLRLKQTMLKSASSGRAVKVVTYKERDTKVVLDFLE